MKTDYRGDNGKLGDVFVTRDRRLHCITLASQWHILLQLHNLRHNNGWAVLKILHISIYKLIFSNTKMKAKCFSLYNIPLLKVVYRSDRGRSSATLSMCSASRWPLGEAGRSWGSGHQAVSQSGYLPTAPESLFTGGDLLEGGCCVYWLCSSCWSNY